MDSKTKLEVKAARPLVKAHIKLLHKNVREANDRAEIAERQSRDLTREVETLKRKIAELESGPERRSR